jgi:hypothetical protein
MDKPRVEAWIEEWQERLRLQDWDISCEIARRAAFGRDCWSDVHISHADGHAHVRLLDPLDYRPTDQVTERDQEFSVIHELLHLRLSYDRFAEIEDDSPAGEERELTINRIAEALMSAKYRPALAEEDEEGLAA